MTVDIYTNNSDNRKVNKNLTLIKSLSNVTFKDDADRGQPQLELAFDTDLMSANYCYIRELGYYYYMAEPVLGAQRMFFKLSTDLLMTYRDDILQLGCIIARQEKKYNAYLKDERLPVLNKQDVNTLAFPKGFSNSDELLLIVNGG